MLGFYSQKLAIATVATLALLGAGCGSEDLDEGEGPLGVHRLELVGSQPTNRLRVFSLNVYQKPWFANVPPDPSPLDDYERATATARRILDDPDGYDAVLLGELFTEDAQSAFVNELHSRFPYYVVTTNSSGLAIFSRFPFANLNVPFVGDGLDESEQFNSIAWDAVDGNDRHSHFAFTKYTDACLPDGLAPKGALLARVIGPGSTHQFFNLVVTHTQSDDVDPILGIPLCTETQVKAVRASQFDQIAALAQAAGVVTSSSMSEQLIVTGDLNVQGYRPTFSLNGTHDAPDSTMLASEYGQTVFGSPVFRGIRLYDTWRLTSDADMGETYTSSAPLQPGAPPQRLDYFLLNGASYRPSSTSPARVSINSKNFCPQWVRTVPGPFDSDHEAIAMDLGAGGLNCAPSQAITVPITTTREEYVTEWSQPSQNFWLYFPHPGTYSIGIPNAAAALGVKLDVLLARDLSVAMTQEAGIAEQLDTGGPTQLKPYASSEPFYVRIYARNGDVTGNVITLVKKHKCSSKADACALTDPGRAYGEHFVPVSTPELPSARRRGFFTVNTYDVAVGTATLRMNFQTFALPMRATVTVTNSAGFSWSGTIKFASRTLDFPYSQAATWEIEVEELRTSGMNNFPASRSWGIAYDTNATLVTSYKAERSGAVNFFVGNETGVGIGSDESRCWLLPDGLTSNIGTAYGDNLDSGRNLAVFPTRTTFGTQLHATCTEFVNGDGGPLDNAGGVVIPSLPWGTRSLLKQKNAFAMGGSGEYEVQYSLLKRLP